MKFKNKIAAGLLALSLISPFKSISDSQPKINLPKDKVFFVDVGCRNLKSADDLEVLIWIGAESKFILADATLENKYDIDNESVINLLNVYGDICDAKYNAKPYYFILMKSEKYPNGRFIAEGDNVSADNIIKILSNVNEKNLEKSAYNKEVYLSVSCSDREKHYMNFSALERNRWWLLGSYNIALPKLVGSIPDIEKTLENTGCEPNHYDLLLHTTKSENPIDVKHGDDKKSMIEDLKQYEKKHLK
ncbi:MAG: hypothetical protein KJ623_04540 [Nanoarchaeota archaeon]|nr:hypothetical protein [Nanoarchaeota archaeon]MBU0962541.1 hypothetical protein [Nanoarchaeota archaeon]